MTLTTSQQPQPIAGRTCGSCPLCCKLLAVETIGKPLGKWCEHCSPGKGCNIYETRPEQCQTFYCQWRLIAELDDRWKPSISGIVLADEGGGTRLVAHVDPNKRDAWRQAPYYGVLKNAAIQYAGESQIVVQIRNRVTVILPDRDIDLGTFEIGDSIRSTIKKTPTGPVYGAEKISKADIPEDQRGKWIRGNL